MHGEPGGCRARLTSILTRIRAAAPDAEIIVVGAYDPNIGAFAFADPLFTQLNQAQQAAAATVRARFADPFPVFNGPHQATRHSNDSAGRAEISSATSTIVTFGNPLLSPSGEPARPTMRRQ